MATVLTSYGALKGFVDSETKAHTFLGVPYAKAERFGPPLPPDAWTGSVRDALDRGPDCVQPMISPGAVWGPEGSEDIEYRRSIGFDIGEEGCPKFMSEKRSLVLNIWTPDSSKKAALPVFFWIHGGAYMQGSAGQFPSYHSARFCSRGGCVVVTINYRLGGLGFLYKPGSDLTPNCGTLDQIAALRWVQGEIANFGGDPHNVTIAGESAGGQSVGSLLGSPLCVGLFHRAISQSGGAHSVMSVEQAAEVARLTAEKLGISYEADFNLSTLRKIPLQELSAVFDQMFALPFVSTEHIAKLGHSCYMFSPVGMEPVYPGNRIGFSYVVKGLNASVPLLIGVQGHELDDIPMFDLRSIDVRQCFAAPGPFVAPSNPSVAAERVVRALSNNQDRGMEKAGAAFLSDKVFYLPTVRLADAHGRHNMGRTFVYEFGFGTAGHGMDVPFTFGLGLDKLLAQTANDPSHAQREGRRLSDEMMQMIFRFMRTGDPSGGMIGYFPCWTLDAPVIVRLGASSWTMAVSLVMPKSGQSRVFEVREAYEGIWEHPNIDSGSGSDLVTRSRL